MTWTYAEAEMKKTTPESVKGGCCHGKNRGRKKGRDDKQQSLFRKDYGK